MRLRQTNQCYITIQGADLKASGVGAGSNTVPMTFTNTKLLFSLFVKECNFKA